MASCRPAIADEYADLALEAMRLQAGGDIGNSIATATVAAMRDSGNYSPEYLAAFERMAIGMAGDLERDLVAAWRRELGLADLKVLVEFYRTAAGRRVCRAQLRLQDQAYAIGKDWGIRVYDEVNGPRIER